MGGCGLDESGSKWRLVADSCEHGDVSSGYIRAGVFLE
jgi:hypothetical protein